MQQFTNKLDRFIHLLSRDVGLLFEFLQGPHQQAEHTPIPDQENTNPTSQTHTHTHNCDFQLYNDYYGILASIFFHCLLVQFNSEDHDWRSWLKIMTVVSFECKDSTLIAHVGLPLFAPLIHGLILNEVSACSLLGGSYYRRLQRRLMGRRKHEREKISLLGLFVKTLNVSAYRTWHVAVNDDNLYLTILSVLYLMCFWSTYFKTLYPGCMLMPNSKRCNCKIHWQRQTIGNIVLII